MEISSYLKIIFFGLCLISSVALLIFIFRAGDQDIDYDKIIRYLNKQKEDNLRLLSEGNKKINEIEKKILECKKKLNMPLFKSKKY